MSSGASAPTRCEPPLFRPVRPAGARPTRSGWLSLARQPLLGALRTWDERLRGGADPDALELQRKRRERFGESFGKGTDLDSSGIYASGEDSLVAEGDDHSAAEARAEKERRGLLRLPKSTIGKQSAPNFDVDLLFSKLNMVRVSLSSAALGWGRGEH